MEDVKVIKFEDADEFEMEIQKCDPDNCNYDCQPYAEGKCDSFFTTLF